jgi:hypothetical protein
VTKKILTRIVLFLNNIGFDPRKLFSLFRGLPFFIRDRWLIKRQMRSDRSFVMGKCYPVLDERFCESGTIKGHYFHQDFLVARKIYVNKPVRHIDIGSRIDGFVAHVAIFREIEIFDIRSTESPIKNIHFTQADLMHLPDNMIECCDSVSSLHAIEHFGLGRYGDPVDIDGHIKAIHNIHLMLQPGGLFYFSVPIGKQRIEFNAHRVFCINYLMRIFKNRFKIVSFSYVDDNGDLFENVELNDDRITNNFNCSYGCGIFELIKI